MRASPGANGALSPTAVSVVQSMEEAVENFQNAASAFMHARDTLLAAEADLLAHTEAVSVRAGVVRQSLTESMDACIGQRTPATVMPAVKRRS